MAADLPGWLVYNPWIHHGDPGPEIYQIIASLPAEQQGPIVSAISSARSELEAVRSKGYAQIGAAVAATGKAAAAKR